MLVSAQKRRAKLDTLLSVGKILNFHGVNGEIKVGYTQGKEEQLCEIDEFFIIKDGQTVRLVPESVRFHKNVALMKFEGINSINEAVALKGMFLKASKSFLESFLEEDEFYIDDLAGLDVYDEEGKLIGVVDYVLNREIEDFLIVKDKDDNELFVPFVKSIVPEVDMEARKIVVRNLPGLLEQAT